MTNGATGSDGFQRHMKTEFSIGAAFAARAKTPT